MDRRHDKMEPIHRAARDGDVAAIDRLVAEDGRRLNAQIEGDVKVDGKSWKGCSPLILAALRGRDAAVDRLLALGADVGLESAGRFEVAYWACAEHDNSSALALLLDAGASVNACDKLGWTPMMQATVRDFSGCAALLIERGGDALDLDATDWFRGWTALYVATVYCRADIVQLLLQAGADPSVRSNQGSMPLYHAQKFSPHSCIPLLLEAALVEPQRSRLLFKARALFDAAHATHKARTSAQTKGHPATVQQQEAMAAAPVYLKQRVAQAQELPRVSMLLPINAEEEELAACVKYALGLEGGGVVLAEGQEPTVGTLPELFVELLELMVPKWDPARKGRMLGEGYIELGGQE